MAHVQAPDFCTIEWSRYTGYALIVGGGATASWIIYLLTEPMAVMRLLANPFLVLELPLLFTCSVGFALFGYMLAAGRKGIVLFLRRFGNEQLNDAIRELMHSRLRRAFRLVTLDDSSFRRLGPRWRGLFLSLVAPAAVCGFVASTIAASQRVAWSELSDGSPFGGFLVLMLMIEVFAVAVTAIAALSLAVAAIRAHFTGFRRIEDDGSQADVMARMRSLKSRARAPSIFAPMATIVTTTDQQWQSAVLGLAELSDVVVIDISVPSESICWELEALRPHSAKVVLVAEQQALSKWRSSPSDEHDQLQSRMSHFIATLPLVPYPRAEDVRTTPLGDVLLARRSAGAKNWQRYAERSIRER